MTREKRQEHMTDCCEQAGCSKEQVAKHVKLYVNGHWHSHPSAEFKDWFENDRYCLDSELGLFTAWNTQYFRDLFAEFKALGLDEFDREKPQPPTAEEIEAMRARQRQKFKELKKLISQIGWPMPEPLPTDYDEGAVPRGA